RTALAEHGGIPEPHARRARRFGRWGAVLLQVSGKHFLVKHDFVTQLAIDVAAPHERPQPEPQLMQQLARARHAHVALAFITRAMARIVSAKLACSTPSCLRPAGVSV